MKNIISNLLDKFSPSKDTIYQDTQPIFDSYDAASFKSALVEGCKQSQGVYFERGARSNHAKKIDEAIVEWFRAQDYNCIQGDNRRTILDVKRMKEYDMGFPGTPVLIESKTCHDSYQKNHKNHINPLVGEDYTASKMGYKLNHVFVLWADCGYDDDYIQATDTFLSSITSDGHNWLWCIYHPTTETIEYPFCTKVESFLNHENFKSLRKNDDFFSDPLDTSAN